MKLSKRFSSSLLHLSLIQQSIQLLVILFLLSYASYFVENSQFGYWSKVNLYFSLGQSAITAGFQGQMLASRSSSSTDALKLHGFIVLLGFLYCLIACYFDFFGDLYGLGIFYFVVIYPLYVRNNVLYKTEQKIKSQIKIKTLAPVLLLPLFLLLPNNILMIYSAYYGIIVVNTVIGTLHLRIYRISYFDLEFLKRWGALSLSSYFGNLVYLGTQIVFVEYLTNNFGYNTVGLVEKSKKISSTIISKFTNYLSTVLVPIRVGEIGADMTFLDKILSMSKYVMKFLGLVALLIYLVFPAGGNTIISIYVVILVALDSVVDFIKLDAKVHEKVVALLRIDLFRFLMYVLILWFAATFSWSVVSLYISLIAGLLISIYGTLQIREFR